MICIIGSETTQNYGLFNDLLHLPEFLIVYAKRPFWDQTLAWRSLRRLLPKFPSLYEAHRSWKRAVLRKLDRLNRIIVIDTALRCLELSFLEQCRERRPGIQIDCWLLNSTGSWTFADSRIHSKLYAFPWNAVMTFDPCDAENKQWIHTGLYNYSKHSLPVSHKRSSDIFYAGSIKGQRGKTLLRLLDRFNEHGVKCRFVCPTFRGLRFDTDIPEGLQLLPERISYKKILKKMMESNCILEIPQDGQKGSTLRYCEAVCYNKKLLTMNPEIRNYPFYDARYMRVFSEDSEIDYDWVKKQEVIDYGYQNEFSPIHLFSSSPSSHSAINKKEERL